MRQHEDNDNDSDIESGENRKMEGDGGHR